MSELSAAAQGLSLFNDEPFRPPHRTATNGATVSFSRASVRRSSTTYSLPETSLFRNQSTVSSKFGSRQSTYNRTTLTSTARPKEPDFLSLFLQTKRLLVDIKFDLLAASSTVELRFIDGLIHAHDLQELSNERLQHLSSLGSRTARDRFAVETYLRTVLQPAYFNLPLKLRETYRDKIDSLQKLLREYEDCFSDSYEGDNYDDGLPEFTPEEAEAALNQSASTPQGHSTASESRRSSATSFEVGPTEPEAAVSNEPLRDEGTTTSDFRSKVEPVSPQRTTSDHTLPTHQFREPLERSLKYFSGGREEDLHSIASARSAHSTASIHSSHSKELPVDFYNTLPDPLPLSSQPQNPTWKDIREGKWPSLPPATKGLLLPREIEDHQTDLPLPPLYTIKTSRPSPSTEHKGERKSTPQPKYKWEERISRNKIIPRPEISTPPLRYAKFSWESESSTHLDDSEVKTVMNSPTGTIRTIDISEDEVLSDVHSDAAVDLRDSQQDTLSIRSGSLSRAASVHVPSYLLGTPGFEQYTTTVPGADDPVSASMYGVETIYKGVQRRFGLQDDPSDDIYYVTADFEAEGEGEISLSVSQHVKVLAMGFPGENGGAWWLVELLAVAISGEHDTIRSIGWVPNANLTPSVARQLDSSECLPEVVPIPNADVENSFGLEVNAGPRPGTPRVDTSDDGYLYEYYQSHTHGRDEEFGDQYTYYVDEKYQYAQRRVILDGIGRVLSALFPRLYSKSAGYQPLTGPTNTLTFSSNYPQSDEIMPVELDSMAQRSVLPFGYQKPTVYPPEVSVAQELVIMATFGERMLNPEYHDLGYTYMTQLDCKLRTAITEARVLFPSTQVQSEKLISLMVLVAENITPDITVDGFMKTFSYTAAFWPGEVKINPESAGAPVSSTTPGTNLHTPTPGNITVRAGLFQVADIAELDSSQHRQASTQPISSAAIPDLKRFPSSSSKKEPSQIIPESGLDASSLSRLTEQEREKNRLRLLFALEAYLMIPNPTALPAVTTTPISTLHSRIHHVEFLALSPPPSDTTISPTELSATLLHAWRGVTFEWTLDPTRHLFYDPPNNRTFIYSNIAFCFLHTLTPVTASTETVATVSCSSLYKNGFHTYHRLLAEIASTYRLLFGNDEFSHNYFRNIDVKRRGDGWYDIFEGLPKADTTPRSHYVVSRDFPMLGERLLVLKGMLRPTGLRELWRDKRDSLQWYTFWAVVFLGCVGIFMGMIQIVVGALQAWASMKALQMPT